MHAFRHAHFDCIRWGAPTWSVPLAEYDVTDPLRSLFAGRNPVRSDAFPNGTLQVAQIRVGPSLTRIVLFMVKPILLTFFTCGV